MEPSLPQETSSLDNSNLHPNPLESQSPSHLHERVQNLPQEAPLVPCCQQESHSNNGNLPPETPELLQIDPESLVGSMRQHYLSMPGGRNERRAAIKSALMAQMGAIPRHLAREFSEVLMKISLFDPNGGSAQRNSLKLQWKMVTRKLMALPNIVELMTAEPPSLERPELNGPNPRET